MNMVPTIQLLPHDAVTKSLQTVAIYDTSIDLENLSPSKIESIRKDQLQRAIREVDSMVDSTGQPVIEALPVSESAAKRKKVESSTECEKNAKAFQFELAIRGKILIDQQHHMKALQDKISSARSELEKLRLAASDTTKERPQKAQTEKKEVKEKQQTTKSQSRYWTPEEHQRFLEGLEKYGPKDVKSIANLVKTRNPTQVRTHAQKYYLRLQRETSNKEDETSKPHRSSLSSPTMSMVEGTPTSTPGSGRATKRTDLTINMPQTTSHMSSGRSMYLPVTATLSPTGPDTGDVLQTALELEKCIDNLKSPTGEFDTHLRGLIDDASMWRNEITRAPTPTMCQPVLPEPSLAMPLGVGLDGRRNSLTKSKDGSNNTLLAAIYANESGQNQTMSQNSHVHNQSHQSPEWTKEEVKLLEKGLQTFGDEKDCYKRFQCIRDNFLHRRSILEIEEFYAKLRRHAEEQLSGKKHNGNSSFSGTPNGSFTGTPNPFGKPGDVSSKTPPNVPLPLSPPAGRPLTPIGSPGPLSPSLLSNFNDVGMGIFSTRTSPGLDSSYFVPLGSVASPRALLSPTLGVSANYSGGNSGKRQYPNGRSRNNTPTLFASPRARGGQIGNLHDFEDLSHLSNTDLSFF